MEGEHSSFSANVSESVFLEDALAVPDNGQCRGHSVSPEMVIMHISHVHKCLN